MKKRGFALGMVLLATAISGCGKKEVKSTIIESTTEAVTTEAQTTTEEETTTETPTEPSRPEIKGITTYKSGEKLNEAGDVSLIASIEFLAKIDNMIISSFDLAIIDDKLICSYVLADRGEDFDPYSEVHDYENDKYEAHIAELNKNTYEVIKDVIVPGKITYIDNLENGIMCSDGYSGGYNGIFYDSNLEAKYQFSFEETFTPYYSADTEYLYFSKDNDIYRYLISSNDTSKVEKIDLPDNLLCSALSGVYTDNDGHDYVDYYGMGSDLKDYNAIYSVDDKAFLSIQRSEGASYSGVYQRYGATVRNITDYDNNKTTYEMYYGEIKANAFTFDSTERYIDMTVMNNGDAYAYYYAEGKIYAVIFDKTDGHKKYDTIINTEVPEGYFYGYVRQFEPVYVSEDRVLLLFSDCTSANFIYEWNLKGTTENWNDTEIYTSYAMLTPTVDMEYIYDPRSLSPKELTEDFAELKAKADAIEAKYGVDVFIGTECQMLSGGYAVVALNDKDAINQALEVLDQELGKYKAEFFAEVSKKVGHLNFYITGQLIGMGGGLDYAGGFQNEDMDASNIFMDCTSVWCIQGTLHHEFSHVIFDIIEASETMDMNTWMALNPVLPGRESVYTYSYSEFGYPEAYQYTIDGNYMGDLSNVYFVDTYGMTYPTEDVARIFEHLLSDSTYVELDKMPNLKAKYDYYVDCMDRTFESITADEIKQW